MLVNSCRRISAIDGEILISQQVMFFRKHFQRNWPIIIALRGKYVVYKAFLTHWEFSEGLSGCAGKGRFTILSSVRLNTLLALYAFRKISQEEVGEGRFSG